MRKQPAKARRSMAARVAWTLCILCAGCDATGADAPPRASVLVVVLDSLHAGRLAPWGHTRATTPHLERLAARGVLFERALSQSSWTLPSVASLFTSLEQERHGLYTLGQSLRSEPDTLAELFARAGYRTRACVQTPVLASARGLGRGFERYEVLPFGNQAAEQAVEQTLSAFEEAGPGPLFAYLHLAPPHMPYQPPPEFARRDAALERADVDGSIASCRRIHRAGLAPEHPDVAHLADLYDGHVAWADALLGCLLEGLPASGAERPLWIVVTSDHGEAFMQHGCQGHNAQVYEEMIHVPLVIAGPGARAGGRVRSPVSLLDLMPTLAELCELGAPRQTPQGRSLADVLGAPDSDLDERTLHFSSRYKDDPSTLELAIRVGAEKLVLSGADGRARLFDLDHDPREEHDLSGAHPERARALRASLEAWHARRLEGPYGPIPLPDAERAALERLGYDGD